VNADAVVELADRINAVETTKGVVYVAGGGSEVFPMLLARGGGSATLLAGRILYAPDDFRDALGCDPGRFVDARAARALAMAAFRHALAVRGDLAPEQVFGLGSTSKLSRGFGERDGRAHEIHAAIQTYDRTQAWSVTLPEGEERAWEERINAMLLLNLLAIAKEVGFELALEHDDRVVPDASISRQSADWHEVFHPALPNLMAGRCRWLACDFLGAVNFRPAPADADLPRLLLPGSFRPLHEGHVAMAEAASRLAGLSCGYEISLFHPEKPPLDFIAIRSRLGGFAGHHCRLYLTNAPTYIEKARLFPGCTFVVGHDSALRIVAPRFYGGPSARDAVLEELERLGTRFLVFGRVDASGEFRDFSAEDFEHPISGFLGRVATPVPGEVFRLDISSTEVRRQSSEEFP
jgi:hypothetical protein